MLHSKLENETDDKPDETVLAFYGPHQAIPGDASFSPCPHKPHAK